MLVLKWIFRRFMGFQVYIYRSSGGKRMGHLRGMPILLLITTGRKSGKVRVTPVMYIKDQENYVITASNNGAEQNPGWFHNLEANPLNSIEVEGARMSVKARRATSEEKDRLWQILIGRASFFEDYRKRARRNIPMVILEPNDTKNSDD